MLNIDLAPALLDLAGVELPEGMQGASWASLAAGEKDAKWRKSFFAQYYKELGGVPTLYGLRTETHKLVMYPGHPEWTEIFDLKIDPYEIRNLADDVKLSAELHAELDQLIRQVDYEIPTSGGRR